MRSLASILTIILVLLALLPAIPRDLTVPTNASSDNYTISPKVGDKWVYVSYNGSTPVGKSEIEVTSAQGDSSELYTVEIRNYDNDGYLVSTLVLVDSKWGIKAIALNGDIKSSNITYNPPVPLVYHPRSSNDKTEFVVEAKIYLDGELQGSVNISVVIAVIGETEYEYMGVKIPTYIVNQTTIAEGSRNTLIYHINNDFKLPFKITGDSETILVLESYNLEPDPLDKYRQQTTTTTTTTTQTTPTKTTETTKTTTTTTGTTIETKTTTTTTTPIQVKPPPQLPQSQLPPPLKVGNEWLFEAVWREDNGSITRISMIYRVENTVKVNGKTLYNLTLWYVPESGGSKELIRYFLIDDKYLLHKDVYVWSRYTGGDVWETITEPPVLYAFYPAKIGDKVTYTVKATINHLVNGSIEGTFVEYWSVEEEAEGVDKVNIGSASVDAFRVKSRIKGYYENGTQSWEDEARYWVNRDLKIIIKWESPWENFSITNIVSLEYDPFKTTTPVTTTTTTQTTARTTTMETRATETTRETRTTTTETQTTTTPGSQTTPGPTTPTTRVTKATTQQPPVVGGGQQPPPAIEPREGGSILSNPLVIGAIGGGLLVVISGLGLLVLRRGRGQGGYTTRVPQQQPPPPPPQTPVQAQARPSVSPANTVICPNCGFENPAISKFCKSCGAPLQTQLSTSQGLGQQSRVCPGCGTMVSVKAKFCPKCGYQF